MRTFGIFDILDYFEQRRKGLVQSAVSNPEDLKPEQLDAIAFDRLKQIVSEKAGHDIDMDHVRIQYRPPVEESEVDLDGSHLLLVRLLTYLADRWSEYSADGAKWLVKYMCPCFVIYLTGLRAGTLMTRTIPMILWQWLNAPSMTINGRPVRQS